MCTPPLEGTTPPVPSSSPAIDNMDISPLPHKAPYFVAQVTLPSPSPEETPEEQTMSEDHLSPEECPTPLAKPTQSSGLLQLPEYVSIVININQTLTSIVQTKTRRPSPWPHSLKTFLH